MNCHGPGVHEVFMRHGFVGDLLSSIIGLIMHNILNMPRLAVRWARDASKRFRSG